jgi:magnesium chelatase subunit I
LLPQMAAVEGCPYHCDPLAPLEACVPECPRRLGSARTVRVPVPVVDLPLGATEDRLVGALDIEAALNRGQRVFMPGLLAAAHRGFLYVDEVNLLQDNLVDLLLDVAASGQNVVEREGLSIRHPARFVLIGSGNPEEGELRPQLLDRFGLSLDVKTPSEIPQRVEVVKRRSAYEADPDAFCAQYAPESARLSERLTLARGRVNKVTTTDAVLERVSTLCQALGTDGLRGELTTVRAARALAALEDAPQVSMAHVRAVAVLALRHRLRRTALDESGSGVRILKALDEVMPA